MNYDASVKLITSAVPKMIEASTTAMLIFPFRISFHSSIGLIHEKIVMRMPSDTAMEIAPVIAQPKVIKYCSRRCERLIKSQGKEWMVWYASWPSDPR